MSGEENKSKESVSQGAEESFVVAADPTVEPIDATAIDLVEGEAAEESLVLDLADLLPDSAGEVVLFTGDGVPINLRTDAVVTDTGISESHVTATGVDVTGLHFYAFEGGITVYSPSDVLILNDHG